MSKNKVSKAFNDSFSRSFVVMSDFNVCPKTSSDEIALKKKDEEKRPLIAPHINRLENVYPYSSSGDEGDIEDDSSGSDLFDFAKSQVLFVAIYSTLNIFL